MLRAIGRALIGRDSVVVTRGGKAANGGRGGPKMLPVDEIVVRAAAAALQERDRAPQTQIETLISEIAARDREQLNIGTITPVRGQTCEAERFAFVNRLDGLIAIGGRGGTRQTLVLALATERPILPVPSFGEAANEVWTEHQADIEAQLGLDEATSAAWMEMPADTDAADEMGAPMVDVLVDSMARRCFVIMP